MAPMIELFQVSLRAQRHMGDKHGVDLADAVEAAESTFRHYRIESGSGKERRYLLAGKTETGRRLWVIYDDEGGGIGRIVTAREALGKQDIARRKRLRGD